MPLQQHAIDVLQSHLHIALVLRISTSHKLVLPQHQVQLTTRHCGVCLQIRAFVSNPHSTSKQELNQSPLAFLETASEPGLEEALKRKDNIIRVRNAQISALWDELHTRQPWKNAIKGEDIVSFPEDAANTTRKLAVLGINTVSATVLVSSARV